MSNFLASDRKVRAGLWSWEANVSRQRGWHRDLSSRQGVSSLYISFVNWSKPLNNVIMAVWLTHTPIPAVLLLEIILAGHNSQHFHFAIARALKSTKLSHKLFLLRSNTFKHTPPKTPLPWKSSSFNQAELLPSKGKGEIRQIKLPSHLQAFNLRTGKASSDKWEKWGTVGQTPREDNAAAAPTNQERDATRWWQCPQKLNYPGENPISGTRPLWTENIVRRSMVSTSCL